MALSSYARDAKLIDGMLSNYANMIALLPLMLSLYFVKPPAIMKRIDDAIGMLSYPMYLCQYTAVIVLTQHPPFWINEPWFRPAIVAVTILMSSLIALLVDGPIEWARARIRPSVKTWKASVPLKTIGWPYAVSFTKETTQKQIDNAVYEEPPQGGSSCPPSQITSASGAEHNTSRHKF